MNVRNQATGLAPAMSKKHDRQSEPRATPPTVERLPNLPAWECTCGEVTFSETPPECNHVAKEPNRAVSSVPKHLQCPSCYQNPELRGTAARRKWWRQVSGPLHQRCYVCNQCGTEWIVEVRVDVVDDIEHKTTRVAEIRKAGPMFNPVDPMTVEECDRRIDVCASKRDATTKPAVALTYQQEIDWLMDERKKMEK